MQYFFMYVCNILESFQYWNDTIFEITPLGERLSNVYSRMVIPHDSKTRDASTMALSHDDPGLLIRQPLGNCMLRIFNYYVESHRQISSLENISKFDVIRFYRSTFLHKRDKDPASYETAIAELVKGEVTPDWLSS